MQDGRVMHEIRKSFAMTRIPHAGVHRARGAERRCLHPVPDPTPSCGVASVTLDICYLCLLARAGEVGARPARCAVGSEGDGPCVALQQPKPDHR
eukprot:4863726-Pyramimonas_sp.AAC.1